MKKVVSLIDLKVMKTQNDCEIACDCVKRANVVLHVGLCFSFFLSKKNCQTAHGVCTVGGEMLATVKVSID